MFMWPVNDKDFLFHFNKIIPPLNRAKETVKKKYSCMRGEGMWAVSLRLVEQLFKCKEL